MTTSHGPFPASPSNRRAVDDWEQWEDDDIVTPIDTAEQVLITSAPPTRNTKTPSSRISRHPTSKLKRLKSRHRQQAQNAKAGIKLITDMTTFRPRAHIAHQYRQDGIPPKFVDAAALKALEGEPNSASVGNWNWLKKNRGMSPASATPQTATAGDHPILIGLSFPAAEMANGDSPHPLTAGPPSALPGPQTVNAGSARLQVPPSPLARSQQGSVWSPDTPDTPSSFNSTSRAASSIYSQATALPHTARGDVPPVPALPAGYKKTHQQRLLSLEFGAGDEDDGGSPYTLFEEDGVPSPQRQLRGKNSALTPDSAASRSHGWWDHVVTPFTDARFTFTSRKQRLESPKEEAKDSWNGVGVNESRSLNRRSKPEPVLVQAPIVRAPTPRRTPSSRTTASEVSTPQTAATVITMTREKPQIVITDEVSSERQATPSPPPYSPPRNQHDAPVRYRAVFPPGHPLQAQFPPSPGPGSPGLAATMTSQGATQMSEIPITPTTGAPAYAPLPIRPVGTSLPQEHSHEERTTVERERQRHEKEDAVARRVGGLWRGRGCIPKSGCFGRTGAEGRKRRRVCMGIWGGIIALIILVIVLAVVLTRPHHSPDVPSIWVNLTDFPPMPTGVLTVVGPDNTVSKSDCTEPSTLWSCSLPKEDHDSVAPYEPDQPTVIMQIQWDNSTRESWNIPNGDPPASVSRRGVSAAGYASNLVQSRQNKNGFKPSPSPPDFKEMWFLGDTTDNITSDQKGGEPTPFYISLLKSINDTVDNPIVDKRQDGNVIGDKPVSDFISDPDLEKDGTPTPAVMLPQPVQQPVRLFDRGLPTEHYGFYTYFKRTIFLKSVTVLNDTDADKNNISLDEDGNVPLDENGGCAKTEANFLATWSETRMLVQIWTQALADNSSKLLPPDGSDDDAKTLVRPGTMPYPVTVSLDTHGGDSQKKIVWEWPMDDRQKLDLNDAKLLANTISNGGTLINPRSDGNEKFGGFDGGTGGCKCEWVNWV